MNRTALALLAFCACHKKEEATVTSTPVDTSVVASPAPSETAAPSASVVASAALPDVDPHIARQAALENAQQLGMIGLLNTGGDGGRSPWGRDDSLGNDPLAARGNMWGDQIGDSFGAGGLGLSGTGASRDGGGGGGNGEGIGLGNIGTIGHGSGTGTGQGFGSGHGRLGGAHGSPRIRQGATTVNGRLPPEVIQRIVRQNFGRFRLCYEQGLRKDPKLSGTVTTKFVIDTKGAVSSATRDASTTLTDATVVSCITGAFSNLSFPQPEGGIVVVVYPVILDPPDQP
jgi:hypothetical protein